MSDNREDVVFIVESRSAADHGVGPGTWCMVQKTTDLHEARTVAQKVYAQGWVNVQIRVEWYPS